MSLCYLPPISHIWHSGQHLSKSPSSKASSYEGGKAANPIYEPNNLNLRSVFHEFSGLSENITPKSQLSSGEPLNNSFHSVAGESNRSMEWTSGPRFGDAPQGLRDEWQTARKDLSQPYREEAIHKDFSIPAAVHETVQSEDDEDKVSPSDLEDIVVNESLPQTASDRRAQKRKMKRFRLTHNQTRYLMAEFARQPHPDTAQRERLSREISGLSSRQVQVWFQNRRAKLKRLTAPDRERMMRSRALPEDFDRSTTLHSAFSRTNSTNNNTRMSPSHRPSESIHALNTPPTLGHRRDLSGGTSSSSIQSVFSEPLWAQSSGPGLQINSPLSPTDRMLYRDSLASQLLASQHSIQHSIHYARSRSNPSIHAQPLDRQSRMRAGSLASPRSAGLSPANHVRRSSFDIQRDTLSRPVSPLLEGSQQPQIRPPPSQRVVDYSPPGEEPLTNRHQPHQTTEYCIQQEGTSAYEAPFITGSDYLTLQNPEVPQASAIFRLYQPYPPSHRIQTASLEIDAAYYWSHSVEDNPRPSHSISYPAPYTSQAPYTGFEGASADAIKFGERQNTGDTPVVGLGLPQHVFIPGQTPRNSTNEHNMRLEGEEQGSTPHPPQYDYRR